MSAASAPAQHRQFHLVSPSFSAYDDVHSNAKGCNVYRSAPARKSGSTHRPTMATLDDLDCRDINTTECILKHLKIISSAQQEQQDEYNWDPVSVAVTAVIGVVALFFAALTIGQALLTAANGRLKASPYAIGPWSKMSKIRLSWSEMRPQTVAYTPVIFINDFMDKSEKSGNEEFNSKTPDPTAGGKPKDLTEYFPATWLSLLTCLDLDYPGLWRANPVGLDYLPDDLAAAPARGYVTDLSMLVLLAAAEIGPATVVFEKDSGLPRIFSSWFDFHFEKHPVMGYLAMFQITNPPQKERHFSASSAWRSRRRRHIQLLHAYGSMTLDMGYGRTINVVDEGATLHKSKWMSGSLPFELYAFDEEVKKIFNRCVCRREPGPSRRTCCRDFKPLTLNIVTESGPMDIVFCKVPEEPPPVFPIKRGRVWEKVKALLLLCPRWSMNWGPPEEMLREAVSWAEDPKPASPSSRSALSLISDHEGVKRLLQGLDALFQTDEEIGDSGKVFPKLNKHKRDLLESCRWNPAAIVRDIRTIDDWLQENAPNTVECRKLTLTTLSTAAGNLLSNRPVEQVNQDPEGTDQPRPAPSSVLLGSLQEHITHFREAINTITESHNTRDPAGIPAEAKAKLMQDLGKPAWWWKVGRDHTLTSLASSKDDTNDRFIRAVLEIADYWKEYEDESGRHKFEYRYIRHPIDDMIVYRSLLISLLYVAATDSSWVLDDDNEDWNRVVSFL